MRELDFKHVYGYQEVKDELNRIIDWYDDETILNNPKITLPKGILFYGDPGNGKSLFVREFLNNFPNVNKYIIEGRKDSASQEIKNVFDKAKADKFSIVVIDELELLVPEDSREQRILQQELDGVVQKGKVLVLATANNIRKVATPLKRPGRFDKLIHIDDPDRESRKEIFKNMLLDLEVDVTDINFDHVAKHCKEVSGATIKAICNDAYLRNKDKPITEEEIEKSYERVENGDLGKAPRTLNNFKVAVHEGGHALLALHFKKNWALYKAVFTNEGGSTEIEEVEERYQTLEKRIQNIMIGFGGYVAEEVVFGYHDYGSASDFESVHDYCRRLIELSCIKGIQNHITDAQYNLPSHRETPRKRSHIERLTYRLMHKYESKVRRFLIKHKKDLVKFANHMCEHGYVSHRDVEKLGLGNI